MSTNTQFKGLTQLLSAPPLLTSELANWQHTFLAYYRHPASEVRQHSIPFHVLEVIDHDSRSHHDRQLGEHRLSYQIHGGETFLCPSQTSHCTSWEEPLNFTVLVFEPSWFEQMADESTKGTQPELIPQWQVFDPLIQSITNALKADVVAGCPAGRLYGETLSTALAIHLIRRFSISKPMTFQSQIGLPKYYLKQVLDYIEAHLANDISLNDLANLVGMSPFYFARLFKQSMLLSPHQYVIRQRVERAKQLLKQPAYRIADIALLCGFAHQSHLSRHFRRLVGVSPKAFRNQ